VPLGGDFGDSDDRVNLSELEGSYEGNLVLVGTEANPIRIDGNLFVSGDVVLKGAVTGRGAIYSGRNVYIAGDLGYVNPPRVPDDGEDPDVVAQENIDANKDELRLAARSNIVLGNYTNQNDDGSKLPIKLRQEEDYFRLQFGLNGTTYFDTETNQELKKVGSKFYDDQDREIPYSRIAEADKYDGAIKPSKVNQDGTVDLWLSDEQYREILGTQEIKDNTWRMSVTGNSTQVVNQLLANGFTSEQINLLRRNWNDSASSYLSGDLTGPDYSFTVRKVEDGTHTYTNQVERVDAFLYSNRRIAGKTSGTNLAIYGGMISQEIGILAPGRDKEWWMQASRYDYLNDVADRSNPINGELYRHLAVNYDYRLRNGGFGFDLVQGSVGRRLLWRMN
jgi:hypothetical protein